MREKTIELNIYKSGVIVDLSVSVWRAIAKLNPEEVGLEKSEVPDQVYLGHKALMKREFFRETKSITFKAGSWLYQHSWSFPVGQCRFVSYATLPKLLEKMREAEVNFNAAVDRMVGEYGPRRAEMIEIFSKMFDEMLEKIYPNGHELSRDSWMAATKRKLMAKLEDKYPTVGNLRSKFRFDFVVFEVAPSEFRGLSTTEAGDKANTAIGVQQEYREKITQKLDAFSESVINKLQEMVLDVTGKLSQRTKAGTLNMNTVKSFRNWIDTFRQLNFVGLDVDGALDDLERKLNETEKGEMTTKEFMDKLDQDINAIRETASRTDVSTVLHKYRRRIEV